MKKYFFGINRFFHEQFFSKKLPSKVSIYFHNVLNNEHQVFREFISYFKKLNYNFVGPEEFLKKDDGKKIFVSFDDNYLGWYKLLPILEEESIKSTFYINTLPLRDKCSKKHIKQYYKRLNYFEEQIPLSSSEVVKISQMGHEIGAHTHSHFNLNDISEKKAFLDIQKNKELLETLIQKEVNHFAFPYGLRRYFNSILREKCIEIGFKSIANAIPGMLYNNNNPYNLYRTQWVLSKPLKYNIENIKINAWLYAKLTGRSFFGGI